MKIVITILVWVSVLWLLFVAACLFDGKMAKEIRKNRRLAKAHGAKQTPATYVDAETETKMFQHDITDIAEKVEETAPKINQSAFKEARREGLLGHLNLAHPVLQILFRLLDAIGYRLLLVRRTNYDRAFKMLKDAGLICITALMVIGNFLMAIISKGAVVCVIVVCFFFGNNTSNHSTVTFREILVRMRFW